MQRHRHSLRFRLAVMHIAVFAAVLVGVGLTVLFTPPPARDRMLLLAVPGGLLVAALVSWWLTGRLLAPLNRVVSAVTQVTAETASRQIDLPPRPDEVAALVMALNQLLERLSAALAVQERFIADVSHELKTPLSVLLGEAQVLMQRERTAEEYARFVASVQDEARSLAQVVDSMLVLARAEAGLPTSFAGEVSLNEVVMDAVQRCQPLARQQEVRLVPHLALPQGDDAPPYVRGDGELVRLMFVNLLRNAIRHSPPEAAVDIAMTLDETGATVRVRDHGPGIPPEYLKQVFQRFFRVPREESTYRGAGLGLAIVRGVARLHGGTVAVSNHPQGGCEFTTRLPLLRRD